MLHSIIIPSSNRVKQLDACLDSLWQAGLSDTEILVVGGDMLSEWSSGSHVRFIPCETTPPDLHLAPGDPPPYWKTRALNVGIDEAKGDVLTFLDADAIVGKHFLDGARILSASSLTRLCYRVRYIDHPPLKADWANYDGFPLGFEAYGEPDCPSPGAHGIVFGNSQFSIRRDVIGNFPWDVDYFGRGYEDINMILNIWKKYRSDYSAAIMTSGDYAMFHQIHSYSPGYGMDKWNNRNRRRYYDIPCVWVMQEDGSHNLVERFSNAIGCLRANGVEFIYQPSATFEAEVNRHLDLRIMLTRRSFPDKAALAVWILETPGLSPTEAELDAAWAQWSREE